MTFVEAMVALSQGKKVTRSSWSNKEYLHLDPCKHIRDQAGRLLSVMDTTLDGWEIYEEPALNGVEAMRAVLDGKKVSKILDSGKLENDAFYTMCNGTMRYIYNGCQHMEVCTPVDRWLSHKYRIVE